MLIKSVFLHFSFLFVIQTFIHCEQTNKKMAFASSSFYSTKSGERNIYQYERSPFTSVSMTSLTYKATDRIISLSKPKIRKETTIRDGKI
jgi:hypothetical protein